MADPAMKQPSEMEHARQEMFAAIRDIQAALSPLVKDMSPEKIEAYACQIQQEIRDAEEG